MAIISTDNLLLKLQKMPNYNLEKLDVLVLEQNPLSSDAIQLLMRRLGVKDVKCAQEVDTAFEIFQQHPIDLVICDWSPTVDGIEFLHMVRNDSSRTNPYIPVILLTAFSEPDHLKKAVNAGINEFISKPFTPRRIYRRIKKVIEVPHFFVRSGVYFGPCRRHMKIAHHHNQNEKNADYIGDERRIRAINMDDDSWAY